MLSDPVVSITLINGPLKSLKIESRVSNFIIRVFKQKAGEESAFLN